MRNWVLIINLFIFLITPHSVCADGGVLVSGGIQQEDKKEKVSEADASMVREYIREIVVKTVLDKAADSMEFAVTQQDLQLFPQVIYLAIQQIAVEVFKQKGTKEVTGKAYDQAYEQAIGQLNDGVLPGAVQQDIHKTVKQQMESIVSNDTFRYIVEKMLQQAMVQQQKIILQTAAQRQAQFVLLQKQHAAMQREVMQQYGRIIQQRQKMVEESARKLYDQQLRAKQEEMKLRYDATVLQSGSQGR